MREDRQNISNNFNKIEVIGGDNCKHFSSLLTESDVIINGCCYQLSELEDNYQRLSQLANNNKLVGEAGHPADADGTRDHYDISFNHTSHKITNIKQLGNKFIGDFTLLNTPIGFTLQQMVREGVQLSTSLRAFCTPSKGEYGEYAEGLYIITHDIVMEPAYEEAVMKRTQECIIESEQQFLGNSRRIRNRKGFEANYKKNNAKEEIIRFFTIVNKGQ